MVYYSVYTYLFVITYPDDYMITYIPDAELIYLRFRAVLSRYGYGSQRENAGENYAGATYATCNMRMAMAMAKCKAMETPKTFLRSCKRVEAYTMIGCSVAGSLGCLAVRYV